MMKLMDEYGVKTLYDVHEFIKMLTTETIQTALDGKLENELGYSKCDYKNKQTDNSRNAYSTKIVRERFLPASRCSFLLRYCHKPAAFA